MLKKIADLLFSNTPIEEKPEDNADMLAMATCVILLEAAWADQEFTDEERSHILQVMQQRFELEKDEAEQLIRQAMAVHGEITSLFRFTSRLNDAFSPDEKISMLEEVWRIIYSDGVLNDHEDHLAHQLRNMLNLNHKQFIQAKLKVLEEVNAAKES